MIRAFLKDPTMVISALMIAASLSMAAWLATHQTVIVW
jgi:hypothetical protein